MQAWIQRKGIEAYIGEQITARMSVERAIMNAVSQWWIGGLRTRKAKVAGSIPAGGSVSTNDFLDYASIYEFASKFLYFVLAILALFI